MAFSISPTTAVSGATITASGTGTRKRSTRIRIDGTLVAEFTMPNRGKFSRLITVPNRVDGSYTVVLQQIRTDLVWAQTASTSLTIKNIVSPPPPPPVYKTAQIALSGASIKAAVIPPPPVDPIPIITLTSITPSTGGAQFKWHISEFAKGWIQYGLTPSYGLETPHENSFNYQDHVQNITGQPQATIIYYQIVAEDTIGQRGYLAGQFTTTGTVTPPPTVPSAPSNFSVTAGDKTTTASWGAISLATYKVYRNDVLIASPTSPSYTDTGLTNGVQYSYKVSAVNAVGEGPRAGPVLATPVAPAPSFIYGPGIGSDGKNNHRIGWNANAKVSHRFRATTTSTVTQVAFNQRGDGSLSTYSGGTGGTIKISIQTDNAGKPSGTILGSYTFSPGNPAGPWEVKAHYALTPTPSLTSGTLYHLVMENVHASPTTNWISANESFYFGTPNNPRNPAFSDDYAVLYKEFADWVVQTGDLPVMDITYANGTHDGNMYFGTIVSSYGTITGTTNMVRERFTVSGGDKTVRSIMQRIKRNSGTAPLIVTLETGTGTLIESVSLGSTNFVVASETDTATAQPWVEAVLSTPRTLTNGQTYNVKYSCAAGTQYSVTPIRWHDADMSAWDSYHFRDGAGAANGSGGQKTTDSGGNWQDLYAFDSVDIQMYFKTDTAITPPPPPAGTPFPPPVTTNTYTVPNTIDSTGATDVTATLQSFLNSVPNGSVVSFKAGGTYRVTTGMLLTKSNVIYEGNGATIRVYGTSEAITQSPFYINGVYSDIEIRNFTLWGSSPTPGVYGGGEHQHGVANRGGIRVNVHHVTIKAVFGDGIYGAVGFNNFWFHHSIMESCGRMGFAFTNGTNGLIENNHFDVSGYGLFDLEPNADNHIDGVIVRNNTARKISQVTGNAAANRFFFGANATVSTGTSVDNVLIENNIITENPMYIYVTIADSRRQNITIKNNTSLITAAGPTMHFAHVDGLTVTGNTQPLSSGALTDVSDCTSTTISGNVTTTSAPPTYGAGIGGDTLANTQLTIGSNPQFIRFRAAYSSNLSTINFYYQTGSGYGAGTGGAWKIEVRTDDGTGNHYPTSTILATQTVSASASSTAGKLVTFSSPPTLVAGTIYHLVFTNTDANPTANFFSTNHWFYRITPTGALGGKLNPRFPITDWAHGYYTGSTWTTRTAHSPVLDIGYSNGSHQGQSYGEASLAAGQQAEINGTTKMARERFTVTGGNKTVSTVGIRLLKITGSTDPLTVTLAVDGGATLDSFTIPASSIATGLAPNGADSVQGNGSNAQWVTGTFASPLTLINGTTYVLRFSTGASSTFWAWVNRRLTPSYNYTSATAFADGVAQKTTDGSNWSTLGTGGNNHDLQFYLE